MTAAEKLNAITDALHAGKTVYVETMTRSTVITPKTAQRWANNGHTLFKVAGESLYMAVGRRFDCIDYCALRTA